MRRATLMVRATLLGCLLLAAAGSVEAALRVMTLSGLWDARRDAFVFVGWAILFNGLAGACAGMAFGTLRAMFASPASRTGGREAPARSRWRFPVALGLVPLTILAAAAARLAGGTAPPAGARSIVLITVDTLRADALDGFRGSMSLPEGLERASTPHLDALAARGCVFLDASTPIPKTPQSVSTIMTGTYPGRHGLRDLFGTLGSENVTLAEMLRERGWTTAAVVTNGLVDRASGIAQGFDVYRPRDGLRSEVKSLLVVHLPARVAPDLVTRALNRFPSLRITTETAGDVTRRAVDALRDTTGRPHFLWVHYLDPHWPYLPPEPWRSRADTEPSAPLTIYDDLREGRLRIGDMIHRNRMTPAEVRRLVSLYAAEVSYTDSEVGRLIDAVHASPDAGSTIIVFTSDHGESLGEHRYFFSHGDLIYQASVRVPLIIEGAAAGLAPGRAVGDPVSLVDLAPTLLDLVQVPSPERTEGRSLVPLMAASPEAASAAAAPHAARQLFGQSDLSYLAEDPWITIPGESGKLRSVRSGPWKLIRYPRNVAAARRLDPTLGAANEGQRTPLGTTEATKLGPSSADIIELFDLRADPAELHDLSEDEPGRVAVLTRALDEWLESRLAPPGPYRPDEKDLLEHLKSLGYVESDAPGR